MNYWINLNTEGKRAPELRRIFQQLTKLGDGLDEGFALIDDRDQECGKVVVCEATTWHEVAAEAGYSSCTGWSIDDVKGRYPKLTDEQANDYLDQHGKYLTDAMCRAGNDYIDLMEPDVDDDEEDGDGDDTQGANNYAP